MREEGRWRDREREEQDAQRVKQKHLFVGCKKEKMTFPFVK